MESSGSSSSLGKARAYTERLNNIGSEALRDEDVTSGEKIEVYGFLAVVNALVSAAESLDVLAKRNFKL